MPEVRTYSYEAMFLFPQAAVSDMKSAVDHIKEILTRNGVEIISLRKWDERRLAFDVRGNKRGLYFLVYFSSRADAMPKIERDFNLSEQLLRTLIVRADHMTRAQMEAADGQERLADEIKLRGEQPKAAAPTSAPAQAPAPVAAATAPADEFEEIEE